MVDYANINNSNATEDKEEERAVSDWAGMRNFEEWLGD
jgi:hypothetical protein